jgi:hypothetical protein
LNVPQRPSRGAYCSLASTDSQSSAALRSINVPERDAGGGPDSHLEAGMQPWLSCDYARATSTSHGASTRNSRARLPTHSDSDATPRVRSHCQEIGPERCDGILDNEDRIALPQLAAALKRGPLKRGQQTPFHHMSEPCRTCELQHVLVLCPAFRSEPNSDRLILVNVHRKSPP